MPDSRFSFYILLCALILTCPFSVYAAHDRLSIREVNLVQHQGPKQYTVKAKESYYSIARKFDISPAALMAANSDKKNLRTGDKIKIPASAADSKKESAKKEHLVSSKKLAAQEKTNREKTTKKHKNSKREEEAEESQSQSSESGNETRHKVEKGETLYSIARKFHKNVSELKDLNHLDKGQVRIGQMLNLGDQPDTDAKTNETNKPEETASRPAQDTPKQNGNVQQKPIENKPADDPQKQPFLTPPATGLYVVQPGETLFSISSRYGIPVLRIQDLNHMKDNEIHSGQTLRLTDGAAQPDSKTQAGNNAPAAKAEDSNSSAAKSVRPSVQIPVDNSRNSPNRPEITITPNQPERSNRIPKEFKEEGMGMWLNSNDLNQAKSVALHREAPVGTVLKVTNPISKKSIFVKVVGSFAQTEDNKNAIVVISRSAAELIGAIDPHFRVELTYAY